jgi:hypothetical protein
MATLTAPTIRPRSAEALIAQPTVAPQSIPDPQKSRSDPAVIMPRHRRASHPGDRQLSRKD